MAKRGLCGGRARSLAGPSDDQQPHVTFVLPTAVPEQLFLMDRVSLVCVVAALLPAWHRPYATRIWTQMFGVAPTAKIPRPKGSKLPSLSCIVDWTREGGWGGRGEEEERER
eukprot:2090514-Rhodomonas_salina.2